MRSQRLHRDAIRSEEEDWEDGNGPAAPPRDRPYSLHSILFCVVAEGAIGHFQKISGVRADTSTALQGRQKIGTLQPLDVFLKIETRFRQHRSLPIRAISVGMNRRRRFLKVALDAIRQRLNGNSL